MYSLGQLLPMKSLIIQLSYLSISRVIDYEPTYGTQNHPFC